MIQKIVQQQSFKVWHNGKPKFISVDELIRPIMRQQLDVVKNKVLTKDLDWVVVIDGEEGVGKSVLAQQIAKYLDNNFILDNLVFTADKFIEQIKSTKNGKGTAIVLDEAFNAANARASMSEVNRSIAGVATEMRQKNLFILIVLPSFFDLDRYFALWRCKALIHVYFSEQDRRQYILFPKNLKKYLYLAGKKTYNYSKPRSPFPPIHFPNYYTVDEMEYRNKKANAFKKRTVSNQARRWLMQRDAYIKYVLKVMGMSLEEAAKIPTNYGVTPLSGMQISRINREIMDSDR